MNADELPLTLGQLIGSLGGMSEKLEEHLEQAIAIGVTDMRFEDHLVIAALRRALDNMLGMVAMADQKNLFCGMPIVRFQIDTAMTLFGRNLVTDIEAYVTHMLEGKERSRFKDRDGKEMTDSYLHKKLTVVYPHSTDLYKYACEFVHFSAQHLHRVLDLEQWKQTGKLSFLSHDGIVAKWSGEEVKGALLEMLYVTDTILMECDSWKAKRLAT